MVVRRIIAFMTTLSLLVPAAYGNEQAGIAEETLAATPDQQSSPTPSAEEVRQSLEDYIKKELDPLLAEILRKKDFSEQVDAFIAAFNAYPLLRRNPTREELNTLMADPEIERGWYKLKSAMDLINANMDIDRVATMNFDQRAQHIMVTSRYSSIAAEVARNVLRKNFGAPFARQILSFKHIEGFNLDLISLGRRWLREPDSREAIAFLVSEIGHYANTPEYLNKLELKEDWKYQAVEGGSWTAVGAALIMSFKYGWGKASKYWDNIAGKWRPRGQQHAVTEAIRSEMKAGGNIFDELDKKLAVMAPAFSKAPVMTKASVRHALQEKVSQNAMVLWVKKESKQVLGGFALLMGIGAAGGAVNVGWQSLIRKVDPEADINDHYIKGYGLISPDALQDVEDWVFYELATLELQCRAAAFREKAMALVVPTDEIYEEYLTIATDHASLLRQAPQLVDIDDITDGGKRRFTVTEQGLVVEYSIMQKVLTETIPCPAGFQIHGPIGLDRVAELLPQGIVHFE